MVFVLRQVENGEILILGSNIKYTLGCSRRNNIHFPDATINKLHAVIKISENEATIQDMDTEFGTWVNKQKISEPFKLAHGDVLVFGKQNVKYVFINPKFEVQLDKEISESIKRSLRKTLQDLNVKLTQNYTNSSTHYVIEKVTLDTLKEKTILKYLIDQKTVITPKYFENILTNIKEAPLLPNLYRYMPEIDEYLINKGIKDIQPKKKRRYLFENVLFIFFKNACDNELSKLILKCGGDSIMYTKDEKFLKSINSYKMSMLIAVNHNSDGKKLQVINLFLRTMKQLKIKIFGTYLIEDIYLSILKGALIQSNKESLEINSGIGSSKTAPIAGTSKTLENEEQDSEPATSFEQTLWLSKSSTLDRWITTRRVRKDAQKTSRACENNVTIFNKDDGNSQEANSKRKFCKNLLQSENKFTIKKINHLVLNPFSQGAKKRPKLIKKFIQID